MQRGPVIRREPAPVNGARGAPSIPRSFGEMTPAWLTAVLGNRGHLPTGAVVTAVEVQPIGRGYMGAVARLRLAYSEEANGAPRTLIAKLPTSVAENRVMGELCGMYWREIHFYDGLRPSIGVRTPRSYHSALSHSPKGAGARTLAALLDRLPSFILEGLLAFVSKGIATNPQQYVLLLEDLAPATPGDLSEQAAPATCELVLRAVAGLHAAFWKSHALADLRWLNGLAINPRMRQRLFSKARCAFEARLKDNLGPEDLHVLDWLQVHGATLSRAFDREAPPTVIHCDLRFENVLIDEGERPEVAFVDWQLTAIGPAAFDVASLLSNALGRDTPTGVEYGLLRLYHLEIARLGVQDYPFERFVRDYHRGLAAILTILCAAYALDLGDEPRAAAFDSWALRTLSRLRGVDLEGLLKHAPAPLALPRETRDTHVADANGR